MKTSITDTIRIEKFLSGALEPDQKLMFQAELQTDRALKADVFFQRMVHRLLRLYHRNKMKAEIHTIHDRLFSDPSKMEFQRSVLKHFNS